MPGDAIPIVIRELTSLKEAQSPFTSGGLFKVNYANDVQVRQAYRVFFSELRLRSEAIRTALSSKSRSDYTSVYQALGDNIRRSGWALDSAVDNEMLFVLPETVGLLIELARAHNRLSGDADCFVIDAIRHPFEARYFRETYSGFYLMAVSTDEADRRRRLASLNFRKEEIDRLDKKEYPAENNPLSGYDAFVSQDIQTCLEEADIYIRNGDSTLKGIYHELTEQLVKYVSLMQHPGLVTPTRMERCMQTAFTAKVNSGCISRQVGAAVTDTNFSIRGIGWNESPKGQVPCLLRNVHHLMTGLDGRAYSKYEKEDKEFKEHMIEQVIVKVKSTSFEGRNLSFCFRTHYNDMKGTKNQVHTRALHAEENAFLQVAKYGGQALEGGYLFTTAGPCELCAKKAYQLGIKKIFYVDPYPGISIDHVLDSGSHKPELELFSGAIGKAYHQMYEPFLPHKDELAALVQPS